MLVGKKDRLARVVILTSPALSRRPRAGGVGAANPSRRSPLSRSLPPRRRRQLARPPRTAAAGLAPPPAVLGGRDRPYRLELARRQRGCPPLRRRRLATDPALPRPDPVAARREARGGRLPALRCGGRQRKLARTAPTAVAAASRVGWSGWAQGSRAAAGRWLWRPRLAWPWLAGVCGRPWLAGLRPAVAWRWLAAAGCGVAVAGRGRLERASNELFGKMVVLLFGGDAGPAPPWWWGRGLFGACWWCRGGVAGCAGLFLVEASWLKRATVLSRECAAGMVKVRA
jgi:hypothetical protein